jgi:inner membrane protease subunit 2
MPPRPPVRLPTKIVPAARAKFVPSPPAPHVQRTSQKPQASPSQASRTPPPPPPPPPSPSQWWQGRGSRRIARYVAFSANVIVGLCLVISIRDHFVRIDVVRGTSMSPTLSPTAHETGDEDWVVIVPYHERPPKLRYLPDGRIEVDEQEPAQLQRGDVVTFWKPHKPEQIGIKRVVAIGGDTVYPKRGYALDSDVVRQKRLAGQDGLPEEDKDAVGGDEALEVGKVVVPYGHVWVEGDNWRNSLDSNDFGPISRGLIEGKAVGIWRSLFDWRAVGDERDKKGRSRVVQGKMEIPVVFLE